MDSIEPFDMEPIKMEPATKQDSIFVKIPITSIHFPDSDKEAILRDAEKSGSVNIPAIQAKVQQLADTGAFDINL